MNKLVVLASGSGSNFQAIIDAIDEGGINAEIAALITNNPQAGALKRAEKADIPTVIIESSDPFLFSSELLQTLSHYYPDLIVLAGFLKKIPASVIHAFPDKVINIHPSLLPKFGGAGFYGQHVHQAVIDSGDNRTGCTVHYVNENYDEGAIIKQKIVPVSSEDNAESLAKKVLNEEHRLLPEVIKILLTQK